jgi:hypothetical protein
MKAKDVDDFMQEMFSGDPEASTVAELVKIMAEGGTPVTVDETVASLDRLASAGMLERVGKGNPDPAKRSYRVTNAYLERKEDEWAETFAGILAEHYIKEAAK